MATPVTLLSDTKDRNTTFATYRQTMTNIYRRTNAFKGVASVGTSPFSLYQNFLADLNAFAATLSTVADFNAADSGFDIFVANQLNGQGYAGDVGADFVATRSALNALRAALKAEMGTALASANVADDGSISRPVTALEYSSAVAADVDALLATFE